MSLTFLQPRINLFILLLLNGSIVLGDGAVKITTFSDTLTQSFTFFDALNLFTKEKKKNKFLQELHTDFKNIKPKVQPALNALKRMAQGEDGNEQGCALREYLASRYRICRCDDTAINNIVKRLSQTTSHLYDYLYRELMPMSVPDNLEAGLKPPEENWRDEQIDFFAQLPSEKLKILQQRIDNAKDTRANNLREEKERLTLELCEVGTESVIHSLRCCYRILTDPFDENMDWQVKPINWKEKPQDQSPSSDDSDDEQAADNPPELTRADTRLARKRKVDQ